MGKKRRKSNGLRSARWEEVRWVLAQAKLALKLAKSFPARVSPWMVAYERDVGALLEALGEDTEVLDMPEIPGGGGDVEV